MNNQQPIRDIFVGTMDSSGTVDHSARIDYLLSKYYRLSCTGHYTNNDGVEYIEKSYCVSPFSNQIDELLCTIKQILKETNQECVLVVLGDDSCYFLNGSGESTQAGTFKRVLHKPIDKDYSLIDGNYYIIEDNSNLELKETA